MSSAGTKKFLGLFAVCAVLLGQAACSTGDGANSSDTTLDSDAQQTRDDNVIKLEINRRLIDDGLGAFKDVSVVVYGGRILLIGSVETRSSADRAGALAHDIEGVKQVINEIQIGGDDGIGEFISDVIIEKSIQSSFLFDDEIEFDHVRVRVINGIVYLIGRVRSQGEFDRAADTALETDDVKQVVNYIEISEE